MSIQEDAKSVGACATVAGTIGTAVGAVWGKPVLGGALGAIVGAGIGLTAVTVPKIMTKAPEVITSVRRALRS